jgi:hypothetical protein
MEIFCHNKIILAILTFPLTEIKFIFTVTSKCQTDADRKKKLHQLVNMKRKNHSQLGPKKIVNA